MVIVGYDLEENMTQDLRTRRRALHIYYQRYLAADFAWQAAQREALAWFPVARRHSDFPIGNPGSPLRKLFDSRERALTQFTVALLKLRIARGRKAKKVGTLLLPQE